MISDIYPDRFVNTRARWRQIGLHKIQRNLVMVEGNGARQHFQLGNEVPRNFHSLRPAQVSFFFEK